MKSDDLMPVDPLTDCRVTETSLTASADMPIDTWLKQVNKLKSLKDWANSTVNWWLGDMIIFGKDKYGEMYSQALDATDKEYQTLKDIVWVCENVPAENRMKHPLTWSHHKVVAKLESRKQVKYLRLAKNEDLSVRQLREIVEKECGEEKPDKDEEDDFVVMKVKEILRIAKSSKSFFRDVYIDPRVGRVEKLAGNGKIITEIAMLAKAILVHEGHGRSA
jgi:hypothetical protein